MVFFSLKLLFKCFYFYTFKLFTENFTYLWSYFLFSFLKNSHYNVVFVFEKNKYCIVNFYTIYNWISNAFYFIKFYGFLVKQSNNNTLKNIILCFNYLRYF